MLLVTKASSQAIKLPMQLCIRLKLILLQVLGSGFFHVLPCHNFRNQVTFVKASLIQNVEDL